MTEPEELGFDQLLEQAQLPEDTVDICLRGDLVAKYNTLHQQLVAIPDPQPGSESLAGNSTKADLQAQIDAAGKQMRRSTKTFQLRALSDRAFSKFRDQHPPRPEDRRDMLVGYNRETLGPALVRACLVDPKPSSEQWEKLRDVLSPGEWSKLDRAVTNLNFSEINVPFSSAASQNPPN